jgi:acid phosphatase
MEQLIEELITTAMRTFDLDWAIKAQGAGMSKVTFGILSSVIWAGIGFAPAQQAPMTVKQTNATFVSNAAAERIPNIDKVKAELKKYHDCTCTCGCYARDLERQADRAIAFLRRRSAATQVNEKLALVLDIDETTLSNYQEIADADFAYSAPVFNAWVETAQAPAIAGTLRLYKEAQRLGVKVFFITGRPETQRAETERNLRGQGFDGWEKLYLRPKEHGKQTVSEYKSVARKQIAELGYVLALNVGDQWSDLKGAPEAELNVKYPDPFYLIP